jgi:hypothetical protein
MRSTPDHFSSANFAGDWPKNRAELRGKTKSKG